MNRINYQLKLDAILNDIKSIGRKPRLLLHSCCAPCSSYVLTYLNDYFDISILFYNPNITNATEYEKRYSELKRFISELKLPVNLLEPEYDPSVFVNAVKGLEHEKEGGKRCEVCFNLRLEEAAKKAKEISADFFCTTLSISPLKNSELLNSIGIKYQEKYGIPWLYSDFKKKGGYLCSIKLSKEHNLYRQDYCGCVYSYIERHPIEK